LPSAMCAYCPCSPPSSPASLFSYSCPLLAVTHPMAPSCQAPSRETHVPPTSRCMTDVSETSTWDGLVFFSSVSEMTRRLVDKLDMTAARIPLRRRVHALVAKQ